MKVGDLVRDKVLKDRVGIVVDIPGPDVAPYLRGIQVLIDGRIHHWTEKRLEVISENR